MKLGDATIENTEASAKIKQIYNNLLNILTESEVGSDEFNYAWDILRQHIDHFKYREMERNRPMPVREIYPEPQQAIPASQACCN